MSGSETITNILLILVVLHFFVGFGYLIYKLSPQKKKKSKPKQENKKRN